MDSLHFFFFTKQSISINIPVILILLSQLDLFFFSFFNQENSASLGRAEQVALCCFL